ncbi:MAG: hypothetical protein ACPGO3_06310 [Magnetospiraceae bacterium]
MTEFETFLKKLETRDSLQQFAALAHSVSPGLYRVAAVHGVT